MKVCNQLIMTFLVATLGVVGATGFVHYEMDKVFMAANFANVTSIPSVVALDKALDDVSSIRIKTWQYIALSDKSKMDDVEHKIAASKSRILDILKQYQDTLVVDDQDRRLLQADLAIIQDYDALREKAFELVRSDKRDMALDLLMANQDTIGLKLRITFKEHRDYHIDLSKKYALEALVVKKSATWYSYLFDSLLIAIVGVLAWATSRSILTQLGCEPKEAADMVRKISAGDLGFDIETNGKRDSSLVMALKCVVSNIKAMTDDTNLLAKASVEGKLTIRADAAKHQGAYRKIVEGFNQTLDAVIGPLNMAANYVDRIAKGDIPPKITDTFNGDFNAIKNNLNLAIDNVNALVADALMLSEAAVEGKLATRANATQHHGDYRKIVQGVNDTLDAIIDPIGQVQRVLAALAKGDLTEKINQNYQGAFAKLRDDANSTVDTLADSVTTIKEASDAINSASKEIALGNSDLSQRTEEQASSLEKTASGMEELASTVKQNADNAKQANQMSAAASEVAMKGGMVVQQVVGTMSDINESSRKIVDIISVIDGIAFQTNILALNAAVEAARAGEQGRGFAVVAGEVRNLAQRSAAAAKEIKSLIGNSVDKVENGSKLVAQAGRTMDEIVASVKGVTDIMGEIAAASLEQSSGIEQVNQAIIQMDDVTQQNAALVEQAAATAESLEEQADHLTSLIGRFRLRESRNSLPVKSRQISSVQKSKTVKFQDKGKLSSLLTRKVAIPKLLTSYDNENWSEF